MTFPNNNSSYLNDNGDNTIDDVSSSNSHVGFPNGNDSNTIHNIAFSNNNGSYSNDNGNNFDYTINIHCLYLQHEE